MWIIKSKPRTNLKKNINNKDEKLVKYKSRKRMIELENKII